MDKKVTGTLRKQGDALGHRVTIEDIRKRGDWVQYLVHPVNGEGYKWVHSDYVTLEETTEGK